MDSAPPGDLGREGFAIDAYDALEHAADREDELDLGFGVGLTELHDFPFGSCVARVVGRESVGLAGRHESRVHELALKVAVDRLVARVDPRPVGKVRAPLAVAASEAPVAPRDQHARSRDRLAVLVHDAARTARVALGRDAHDPAPLGLIHGEPDPARTPAGSLELKLDVVLALAFLRGHLQLEAAGAVGADLESGLELELHIDHRRARVDVVHFEGQGVAGFELHVVAIRALFADLELDRLEARSCATQAQIEDALVAGPGQRVVSVVVGRHDLLALPTLRSPVRHSIAYLDLTERLLGPRVENAPLNREGPSQVHLLIVTGGRHREVRQEALGFHVHLVAQEWVELAHPETPLGRRRRFR